MNTSHRSEIARLRQEIELAYESAKRALTDFAITTPHEFINARQEHIATCHETLKQYVGEEEAIKIVFEAQIKAIGE